MLTPDTLYMRGLEIKDASGNLQDADTLPTGVIYQNGVANSLTVTMINETTPGIYFFTFTVPGDWTVGDLVSIKLSAAVDTVDISQFLDLGEVSTVQEDTTTILERLAEQVPTGPVLVIASPTTDTTTTAYGYTLNELGVRTAGIRVRVRLISVDTGAPTYLYSGHEVETVSDSDGLAQLSIPRGTSLLFEVFCGYSQRGVRFSGVDAETLELPALLEKLPGSNC